MRKNEPNTQRRWRGALMTAIFGCIVAGPLELFDSGFGWKFVLAALLGAAAGGIAGFLFPTLLAFRKKSHNSAPPPYPPPPPPSEPPQVH
ncbi:hypothetical protein FGF04_33310 [Streptomyces apricus]|uniref:Uncharacterized protein n=1 Tax=Streptomyces apricus TaxID=1828112 RepID=A0A5B0A2A7_9ACTN|nr:hypothetical protein FGF04_33310 [Streptomyces apricus]